MANTFKQAYFHLVFAVRHREALIKKEWKDQLVMYIIEKGVLDKNTWKFFAKTKYNLRMNIFLTFMMILGFGNKYSGALHLGLNECKRIYK